MRFFFLSLFICCSTTLIAQFQVIGDAVMIGTDTFRLTEDILNENGSVWHKIRHDFRNDFRVSGQFYFGDFEDGADGIVFVIQDNCIGGGSLGLGIGYGNFPGRSLGIEFDTYQNVGGMVNDPVEDHIAISRDGSVDHLMNLIGPVQMHPTNSNVEDGNWYDYTISYNATSQMFEVYFDGSLRLTYTIDLTNEILAGNPYAYWGFTSATGGFSAANALSIDEFDAFTIPDYTICSNGDGVTITMPDPDIQYTWSPTDGLTSDMTGQTVTLNPDVTTEYTVTQPDICLGSVDVNFTVNVSDFELIPSSSAVTCQGDPTGIATVTPVGDSGPYTFLWSTGGTDNTIINLEGGSYLVTVTDSNMCEKVATIIVTEFSELLINPDVIDINCFGESTGAITLNPQGGISPYEYVWSNAETDAALVGLQEGTYMVTVTDNVGCVGTTSILIQQPDAPLVITIDEVGAITCDVNQGTFASITVSGGTEPYTYLWSNGDNGPTATDLPAGDYDILVTDNNDCTATETITITADNPLSINPIVINITCDTDEGGSINIETSGGSPPLLYSIDGGINFFSNNVFENLDSGTYEVVVEDANGCLITSNETIQTTSTIIVDAGTDQTIQEGQSVMSDASIDSNSAIIEIIWSPSEGLSCIDCEQPTINPLVTTLYTMTVIDESGCEASDQVLVTVTNQLDIFIPNIFTPNSGDVNSEFKLFGDETVANILKMQIYDRWGNLIFKAENLDPTSYQGWDGTFSGEPVAIGVYAYFFDIELADGSSLIYKGDVTLIK